MTGLQESFDPAGIPGPHPLGDAAAGQEVQVAVPIGRRAVLAAGAWASWHCVGPVGSVRIQSSTRAARDKLDQ